MTRLVISLSSVPPRFGKIGATLDSLVAQGADKVLLYIPTTYRRFPDWDGTLPQVPEGVEIRQVDEDWGPATKVLGAAHEFRGQDVDILFCDDDQHYPPGWARRFLDLKARHPGAAICILGFHAYHTAEGSEERDLQPRAVRRWRITDVSFQLRFFWQDMIKGKGLISPTRKVFKRSGYVDCFEGRGGVLVRPEHFDDDSFDVPKPAWPVDDVWLSACVARQGVPIWLEANVDDPTETEAQVFTPLSQSVVDGADRITANRQAVEYVQATYGIWT